MLQYPTLPSFCLSSRDWVKSHQRLRPVLGRAEGHMLRPSPALLGKPSSPLSLICIEVGKNTESSRVSFTHLLLMRISYITRHIWQSERSALERHCRLSCRLRAPCSFPARLQLCFHLVLSDRLTPHSQSFLCLTTLAILLLSPCPLSHSRISYRPIQSQTFNVATVDLEILILPTQRPECWNQRQKSLCPVYRELGLEP